MQSAEVKEGDKDRDGLRDYAASLAELRATNLIDGVLATGRKGGYVFAVTLTATGWSGTATPESDPGGAPPIRSFYVDETGKERARAAFPGPAPASAADPIIWPPPPESDLAPATSAPPRGS